MADFVVGHTEAGGVITDGKKLAIRFETYEPLLQFPSRLDIGLDADAVLSLGTSKKAWAFDAVVPITAATGWADKAFVDALYADTSATTNLLKLQSLEGSTVYNAVLMNKSEYRPKVVTPGDPYAASAVWLIHMEFIQR